MGCAASSQQTGDNRSPESPKGTAEQPNRSPHGATGDPHDAAGATAPHRGEALPASGNATNSISTQALTNGTTNTANANAFATYTITDQRGCKVTTVIQNKSKVETMCRWLDNVLKSRDDSGGKFANPQTSGRSNQSANPTTSAAQDANRDTSSISSRTVFHKSTEYGSMASQTFLGVSTFGGSQSRGNATTAAVHGSDDEETAVASPTVRQEVDRERPAGDL